MVSTKSEAAPWRREHGRGRESPARRRGEGLFITVRGARRGSAFALMKRLFNLSLREGS